MPFSSSVPYNALENPNTEKFVRVLDALHEEKHEVISAYMRSWNPLLCNNSKWLRYKLESLGFYSIPDGMPIPVMQQMLLNADTILRLRGSRLGFELFCSVCSLGQVSLNEYPWNKDWTIYPDSLSCGYITGELSHLHDGIYYFDRQDGEYIFSVRLVADNSEVFSVRTDGTIHTGAGVPDRVVKLAMNWYYTTDLLYLCGSNDSPIEDFMSATIRSVYFNEDTSEARAIKEYINSVKDRLLGFNTDMNVTFQGATTLYYHELLNKNFIN